MNTSSDSTSSDSTPPDSTSPAAAAPPLLRRLLGLTLPAGVLAWLGLACSWLPSVEAAALRILSGPGSLGFLRLVAGALGLLFLVLFCLRRPLGRLADRLAEDVARVLAATPSLPPAYVGTRAWPVLLWILTAAGLFAVIQACVAPQAYERLIQEDGVVEQATALSFLAGALATFVGFFRVRTHARVAKTVYALMTLFLIVCMGEEISWGQRIFGFASPEGLAALNKQGEANLHDIGSISVFENAFFLLTLVVFLLVPYLLRRTPGLRVWLHHHDLPRVHPRLARLFLVGLVTWVVIGSRFGTLGFHPFSLWGYYTQLDDEIFEFVAAFCFFAFALLDLVIRRHERAVPTPPAA